MISLLLAILCSVMASTVMHLGEARCRSRMGMLSANYLICSLCALCTVLPTGGIAALGGPSSPWKLGLFAGAVFLAAFVSAQWNTGHNGLVLTTVYSKLGVVISILGSVLLYGEKPGVLRWAGIALAVAAIFLTNEGRGKAKSLLPLLLLLLLDGTAGFTSKIQDVKNAALSDSFLAFTFCTAFVLSALLCAVRREKIAWRDALWGGALGLCNFLQVRFRLEALKSLPGTVVFPFYSAAGILLVSLTGFLFFREKPSRRRLAALGLILVSLVLLNL